MGKVAAHEFSPEITKTASFNAILLDIIERSKPNGLIKSAALHATLNDEGILKVASEDSYWTGAQAVHHLDFLSGVYDINPDMAWRFAANAGLAKEAGIGNFVGAAGRLLGRGAKAGGGALQAGRQAVGRTASGVSNWWKGTGTKFLGDTSHLGTKPLGQAWSPLPAGQHAINPNTLASNLANKNPFQRAAQRVSNWWSGSVHGTAGMQGPGINPLRRAGQNIAYQAERGFEAGKAGAPILQRAPKPAAAAAEHAAPAASQGAGAAGHAVPAAPEAAAGAAGQVAPRQSAGREAWETTKAIGRGARNLGYAGIIGGTVLGAAGLSAAGNLVRPNPSPYQYGMGGPTPWMSPQQM